MDGLLGDVIPSMKECLFVDELLGDVIPSMKQCLFMDGLSCKALMRGIMSCFPLGLCSRVILRGKVGCFPAPFDAQLHSARFFKHFPACNKKMSPPTTSPHLPNIIATSHMASRTFIGNIYKKVKDPNLVASLTGHTEGSKAFSRYRDIDTEMKKELVGLLD